VVHVVPFGILFEEAEASGACVDVVVDHVVQLGEVNGVIVSNYLTLALGLQTHLHDVSRLVIEEPMGISQPRNGSEEHNWLLGLVVLRHRSQFLADFLGLRQLTLSVRWVSVHIVSINRTRHFGAFKSKYRLY